MSSKILTTVSAENFIGRTRESEALLRHAAGDSRTPGLLLLSAPNSGGTELLRQIYDRLFDERSDSIPFYFAIKKSDKTAKNCAARFLHAFLTQTVAYRRREAQIVDNGPDVCELVELTAEDDKIWVERLVAGCKSESLLNDERAFIRNCLSAPLRAAASHANSFVMIDNLHEAEYLLDDVDLIEEIKEIFHRARLPFVLAGRRRFLLSATQTGNTKLTDAEILHTGALDFSDAGFLTENLAAKYNVKINEQTRDLMARQFDGNPAFIKFMLQAAGERQVALNSYQKVQQVYTDELLGGRIGRFYEAVFHQTAPHAGTRKNIIETLNRALTTQAERRRIEDVYKNQKNAGDLSEEEFYRSITRFNSHEILRLSSNFVEPMSENQVLSDYIRTCYRLEIAAENRAAVVGELLSEFLKRAPQTMAKFYRQNSVIHLRELLSIFNCQEAPVALLDYSIFKEQYKGAGDAEILASDSEKVRLPQIVYTAHTVAFYAPFAQLTEKTRSAVALGFEESNYTDEDETVWIAAEIDSKLEASKESTEFWCDRLEMVALNCNFLKYKIWLVAPEGFAPEAVEVLHQRNAFGSSRKQVELLKKFLKADDAIARNQAANEYEIIIPMGEDTELIAANAVEEIARHHDFEPKAINQIKTALVEACINATEHSLSPDRKIYQKFTVEDDRIVITISNRGLRFVGKNSTEMQSEEGRRGWGIKLMRNLMDEVKFEQVDDGTRISMTKYLKK